MGPFTFAFLATALVVSALTVVVHPSPVKSAMALVVTLFLLAVVFVFLGAHMIAALQVIVYAGAIMVLFLFVIMLLNLQHRHEPATRPIQQFLGYVGPVAFGIGLIYYLGKYAVMTLPNTPFSADTRAIGVALFESYIFPFEAVSILILAAIVCALLLSGRSAGQRAEIGTEVSR